VPKHRRNGSIRLSDLRYGLKKGRPTTAIEQATRPRHRKGIKSTKTQFVRSVVREVAGFAPYERRVLELLRNSKVRTAHARAFLYQPRSLLEPNPLQDKKARKLTKKRVGLALTFVVVWFEVDLSLYHFSSEHSYDRSASSKNCLPLSRRAGGRHIKSKTTPIACDSYSYPRCTPNASN